MTNCNIITRILSYHTYIKWPLADKFSLHSFPNSFVNLKLPVNTPSLCIYANSLHPDHPSLADHHCTSPLSVSQKLLISLSTLSIYFTESRPWIPAINRSCMHSIVQTNVWYKPKFQETNTNFLSKVDLSTFWAWLKTNYLCLISPVLLS